MTRHALGATSWAIAASTLAVLLAGPSCSATGSGPGPGEAGGEGGSGGNGASSGSAGTSGGGSGGVSGTAGSGAGGSGGNSGSGPGGSGGNAGSGTGGSGGNAGGSGGAAGNAGTGSGGAAGNAGVGGAGGSGGGDRTTPEGVCARWNGDRVNLSEGTWNGNVDSCTAGDISADGRANALRLYNLYRWLADLPAVTTDPERDRRAQACAFLMRANGPITHTPPMSWRCWTQEGADGARSSNISSGPGVAAADGYMHDPGNPTTIGHRRWILSNSLGPIGLGSTASGASCMQNLSGTGRAGKPWMAWPPPGIVPLQAIVYRRGSLDSTGWTVQSDSINLSSAAVTVTSGGTARPVTVTQLLGGYGSRYAFRFNPQGWATAAGQTYSVSVTGIATPISYDVTVVDCSS
jgi:hypothetical protein